MKKHLKTFLLITILASCGFKKNSFENYSRSVDDILLPARQTTKKQNLDDLKDINGCGFDFELGQWSEDKNRVNVWERHVSSRDAKGINGYGNYYLDSDRGINKSNFVISYPDKYYINYIGPWKFVPKINKEIRFVAYQSIDYKNPSRLNYHGTINYFFESKNALNKNIKAQSFSLLKEGKPSKSDVCSVKWIANYGYNAIAEVKSKNSFSKDYLVPTGKIIEAKE